MARSDMKALFCAVLGGAVAVTAIAQDNSAAQPASLAANPIVSGPGTDQPVNASATPRPRRARVISPEVAAQLSAAAPKYTPPAPKPPAPPEEEETDMRDVDKPRNGIIRLPKYVVTQPRPPVLSERAVNTKKGLADLAMQRYFGEGYRALNSFTVPLFGTSAEQRAMAMYEEDERLRNMADLSEDARMISSTDKEQGRYVKRLTNETYSRPGDFDWKPIGR